MNRRGSVVFVHDHRFFRTDDGRVWSPGKLTYRSWERYLLHFDRIIVVGRDGGLASQEIPNLVESSGPRVSFELVPDSTNILLVLRRHAAAFRKLQSTIASADGLIARLPSDLGLAASRIAREHGKPMAFEVVGCTFDALWSYGPLLHRLYAPLSYCMHRFVIKRANHAIYVTDRFLQRRYPCKGVLGISSNVELPAGSFTSGEPRLKASPVFGTIGKVDLTYKGHEIALRALARLRAQGLLKEFTYELVGDGSPEPVLRLAQRYGIADCVKVVGVLPGLSAVCSWLDRVDIYLQPSFQEGLPRALIEAMARGRFALASDAGGCPELLEAEAIHRAGDWKTLATQIGRALEDRAWVAAQCSRNAEHARKFSKENLELRRFAFWRGFSDNVQRSAPKAEAHA